MSNRASGRIAQRSFVILCLLPAIALVLLFMVYPFFQSIGIAFQKYTLFDLSSTPFVGFSNFEKLFADSRFWKALQNSFFWVFASLFLQSTIGFGLALLLKKKFRGRGIYTALIFYPWAMAGFLIGIVWRWMFNGQIGVVNDLLIQFGLIQDRIGFTSDPSWSLISAIIANVWYGIAFFAIFFLAALQGVPNDLYEAAAIDGSSKWKTLIHITIPYIMPVIIATTLLRAIWIFNFPDIIYALTNGGPAGSSDILSTYMVDKVVFGGDYGLASAVGIIMVLLLTMYATFYLVATKRFRGVDI